MSLSKCLGKIKLNDSLKTLINKEVEKQKKAKIENHEMVAIESLISNAKDEIDYVREKIGGDIGKVQFNVSNEDVGPIKVTTKDGKVLYQSATNKSENFKKWFGKSKLIDEKGDPLTLYHGTKSDIKSFNKEFLGSSTGKDAAKNAFFFTDDPETASLYGYLAPTEKKKKLDSLTKTYDEKFQAGVSEKSKEMKALLKEINKLSDDVSKQGIGGKLTDIETSIIPVNAKLENPLVFDNHGGKLSPDMISNVIERAKKDGHDGVIFKNTIDSPKINETKSSTIVAVFNAENIKSVNNSGEFNPNNPDILFQSKFKRDNGYQTKQTSVDLPDQINVTKISKPIAINTKNDLTPTVKANLKLGRFKNEHIGEDITINENTLGKLISQLGIKRNASPVDAKNSIMAISEMDQIIKNAIYYEDGTDFKDKNREFKYLFAPLVINGKDKLIQLQVISNKDNELYDFKIVDIKRERGDSMSDMSNPDASGSPTKSPLSPITLSEFEKIFNSAKDDNEFFQSNQQDPNASIQFREDGLTIVRLFKSADASSFMHEMGHLFLQRRFDRAMSGDASNKEIAQFKKLAEFLGYNPETQTKLTVEQHEKFAQAFEQYLKEGKSPIRGMRGVFTKFRKWLTNIYGAAKVGGIEITPEIREIMDSMIQTDRLIQLSKLESGQAISSVEQVLGENLTDKVKDKILTLKERAEELAFSRVFKDQYKKTTEEYKKDLEKHKKDLIKKFTKEIDNSEIGKTIDLQKEILGTDKLKRYAQKIIDNKLNEEDKLKAEVNAERLGFTSADHMAKALVEQPTKEDMVKDMVNQEMAKIESEKDPAFIKQMVDEKIRNEASVDLLALEKELLIEMATKENNKELEKIAEAMEQDRVDLINEWLSAKELNEQRKQFEKKLDKQKIGFEKEKSRLSERYEKKLQTEKQRRLALEWKNEQDAEKRKFIAREFRDTVKFNEEAVLLMAKTESEIVKRKASEMLANKPFREASRFTKYFNAEKMAALKVAKAIQNGDLESALKAKHEQMLNHALAKESVRISKLTNKQINFLKDLRTLNKENWKEEDHWLQGSKILDRFGFTRSDFDSSLITESLESYAAKLAEKGFDIEIPDWIANEATTRDLSALKVSELQDVVDLLKNIRFIANVQDKLFSIEQGMNIATIQEKLIDTSKKNVADKKRIKLEFYPNSSEKIGSFFRSKFNALKTMETMLYVFDKYKDFGTWSNVFVKSITLAANDESVIVKKMLGKFDEIYSNYTDKELKKFRTEKVFIDNLQVSLTKETLLSMALNLGNNGNRERLFSKAPVGVPEHLWNENNIIASLEKVLDERDWKFVQDTWDHIDSYWPDIKKLHRDVTGFSPGKIDADEFSIKTKDGKLIKIKGGYYPLASDTRSNIVSENRELSEGPLYTEKNPAWKAATKKNFTKQRASQAKYAVKLTLDVMHEHLFNVAHDVAFRKTIIDLNRITNSPELQSEIESVIGRDGLRSLTEYIKSAAMKDPEMLKTGDIMDGVIRSLRNSTSKYMLAVNLKNIIQNLANISIYGGAVQGFTHLDSMRAMIKALPDQAKIMVGERPIHEFVNEKSSFMRDRGDNPEFSIKESAGEKFGEGSRLNRVAQSLMAFTDNMTAEPIWLEAYYKKLNEGASEKDAIDFADTLIRRSIGSGRRYDQAAIYRSGELTKMFMMFSSFLNVQYNRFVRETGAIIEEKDVWRALSLAGSQMIFIVSSATLTGKFGADDDEEEKKKTLVQELTNYPMSMIPIVRDIGPIVMDRLVFDKPSSGLRGSPALEVMNASLGAVNAIASENTTEAQKLEAVVKVPMLATGTPKQFSDWFWNSYDIANGMEAKPGDLYRRRPKNER